MHILFITVWHPGPWKVARGTFVRDQVLGQQLLGHQVGVIHPTFRSLKTMGGSTLQWAPENDSYPVFRRTAWRNPVEWLHIRQWHRAIDSLFRSYVEVRGTPDLIHAHGSMWAGLAALPIARRIGCPVVLTEHSSAFLNRTWKIGSIPFAKRGFLQANRCIAVSTALANGIRNAIGPLDIQIIPNSIPVDLFSPAPEGQHPVFTFVSVGALDRNKGHQKLLEAFALACAASPARLLLIGEGPEHRSLQAAAIRLGIGEQVVFKGQLSRTAVADALRESDVLVVSSDHETFGVAAIEGLFSGLPVLSTTCGGPEEIVGPDDGWLIERGSVQALANGLGLAMGMTRAGMMDRGSIRERAVARFGLEAVARQYETVYGEVLAGRTYECR